MPKLPDMEYAVVSQGPPNALQAFGAAAQAIGTLDDVTRDAAKAFAEELAKTQVSEASLRVEAGLGDLENTLKTKPYLSRAEVMGAFGGTVPAEVRAVLDAAGPDDKAPTIETWRVGGAMHRAAAQRLAEDAAPTILAPQVRKSFEQRAAADAMHRGLRFEQEMAQEGARLQKAKTLAINDARARLATTPAQWAEIYADVQGSRWFDPAEKEKYLAHYAGLQATQGKARTAAGLAESALKSGRNDITPWVDAAVATANFESMVANEKDPLVVQDARQKFIAALEANEKARKASDAPALARIRGSIASGRGYSPLSDDFQSLSDEGKAHVQEYALAERMRSKSASAEERRIQREIDEAAKKRFAALDPDEQLRVRPWDEDLGRQLGDAYYGRASGPARDEIAAAQKKIEAVKRAGLGVALDTVKNRAKTLADAMKWTGSKATDFVEYVSTGYGNLLAENEGKKPTEQQIAKLFTDAVTFGEEDPSEVIYFQKDMFAWEAALKRKKHTAKGFENQQPGIAEYEKLTGRTAGSPVPAPAPGPSVPQADADRIQAAYRARYPGRPPLTTEQVQRALAAEKAGKGAR